MRHLDSVTVRQYTGTCYETGGLCDSIQVYAMRQVDCVTVYRYML